MNYLNADYIYYFCPGNIAMDFLIYVIMIKINGFSVVHWDHNNEWFVCFPDGSGIGIPDKYSLRVVMKHVLFWIKYGITNCFDAHL